MAYDDIPVPRKGKLLLLVCVVGALAAFTVSTGVSDRARSLREVGAWTQAQIVPSVTVVQPKLGPGSEDLVLPGTLDAFSTASLYARASGYVTNWTKDIGARVAKGEVLADISAPDLDQQLAEARANLLQLQAAQGQAQANADLGDATNTRTSRLVVQGWSSQAQGDTDRFNAASRKAGLAVARANIVTQGATVSRLEELARFKRITAPFDGIVTARALDIGDLVSAGGIAGKPLFRVSDLHRMRIYVNVPQAYFGLMTPGLRATLRVPGQEATFEAAVSSTANAIAEDSRTALVQLQADNRDGKLWPGAFANVTFHLPSDPGTLRIPATALIFGRQGLRVAAVQPDNRIALKVVNLGRNLGTEVEVKSGVVQGDRLVDNPQETLEAGDLVHVFGEPEAPPSDRLATLGGKSVDR